MTGYTHSELNLTDPTKGYTQFVLYTEPRLGVACASLNATVTIRRQTPYGQEWRDRLQRCVPSAMHATLVDSMMIPKLFEPCVDEDTDNSSAVRRSSCACYRTWYDPEFGLPVVGEHYRTVSGDIDDWTYTTYTPLDLRPDDVFASLIIDGENGLFWARTADGTLSFLPQEQGRGYGFGRTGGGPTDLADYLTKLLASDGKDTAAGGPPYSIRTVDQQILAWVESKPDARHLELTFEELRAIQRG
ncbi:hypothetical protein [Streptomyces platensis]|uniref:hypothetical protein n=1 Tax=Streptomyces platensis TaxID=58346 RepID=UPI002F907D03|nr:hypothetical protein OG962_37255 [Streptomyces platensis]